MSDAQRVHVAGDPVAFDEAERRIVQPCARCGVLLAEYDRDNPPSVICAPGETPKPIPWYGIGEQYGRDPGYPDGGSSMTFLTDDDEVARDGLRLCDPNEVPVDVEVVRP